VVVSMCIKDEMTNVPTSEEKQKRIQNNNYFEFGLLSFEVNCFVLHNASLRCTLCDAQSPRARMMPCRTVRPSVSQNSRAEMIFRYHAPEAASLSAPCTACVWFSWVKSIRTSITPSCRPAVSCVRVKRRL
jgi:hypothetical protein